jgi:hypothetical protein
VTFKHSLDIYTHLIYEEYDYICMPRDIAEILTYQTSAIVTPANLLIIDS